MEEKVRKKHKALLTQIFKETVKPLDSVSESVTECSSATETEPTTSELKAVTSGLKRLLSGDEGELLTLKKERLSFHPPGKTMADNDTARLKKERAERAALKKRADLEAAARKAEQKATERGDREIKAHRKQEEVLVGRKNGRTQFLEKR